MEKLWCNQHVRMLIHRVMRILVLVLLPLVSVCQQREIRGRVLDADTRKPLAFTNIGFEDTQVGTVSDPDGSFLLRVAQDKMGDSLLISALGYVPRKIASDDLFNDLQVELKQKPILLSEVPITGKRRFKKSRLGWMRGEDGTLPVAIAEGGACVTLLLEAPSAPFLIDAVMLRILYNTKDTLQFRLRVFDVDSLDLPGDEILDQDVMLTGVKKIGWITLDISELMVEIRQTRFHLGIEWLETRSNREALVAALGDWDRWKQEQYKAGDTRVKLDSSVVGGKPHLSYQYQGNMMNWPGFEKMPPWTGLVVDDKKRSGNTAFRSFQRDYSFGPWYELRSVLNAVVKISY